MTDENISKLDENTYVTTSTELARDSLEKAVYSFNNSNFRSTYFNESSGFINFKIEDVDNLAHNAQTDLDKINKINNIVRYFVNKNSILGKVYESIETNINSEWELTHKNYSEEEKEIFDTATAIIKDFNNKINLGGLITDAIPMAFMEGNFIFYLRKDIEDGNYHVDHYPLGISQIADYTEGGEPYVLIDIKELQSRLRKIYRKNKKNRPLFYKDMDEEISETYPKEVSDAYKKKEQFAILDIKNSGVIRVNNLKRKYGLSPIFKALKSVIRLENIELSDDKNTMVRGKKIIFQKLSKELFTDSKVENINWYEALAKAHSDLISSLKGKDVAIYTGMPWTESVSFVESKIEPTNVQVRKSYKDEIMTAIGISHLSADKGSVGASQISINELLKIINRIGEQLEIVLVKWYKDLLIDHGIDTKYCPDIKIIDSEKLNVELSMQLARMLNTELNASLETVYNTLGLDINTEAKRRKEEEELGYDHVFKPRQTAYTNNGSNDENKGGRPSNDNDVDKKDYDQDYNQNNDR